MPKAHQYQTGLLDTWGRRNRQIKNKKCPECKIEFKPKNSNQKHCSRACGWKNNGGNSRPAKTFDQHIIRFWTQVIKKDGCWDWIGSHDKLGYGQFRTHKWRKQAHKMAFELTGGVVPKGKELDHLCKNKGCCNPNHVEPVTHKINIQRYYEK